MLYKVWKMIIYIKLKVWCNLEYYKNFFEIYVIKKKLFTDIWTTNEVFAKIATKELAWQLIPLILFIFKDLL